MREELIIVQCGMLPYLLALAFQNDIKFGSNQQIIVIGYRIGIDFGHSLGNVWRLGE